MDETHRAIHRQRSRWISAINEGDPQEFVAVLTDDAVWLPARHDAIAGRDAIRAWLQGPFAEFDYDYSVSNVRVRVAGAWAVEEAQFTTRAQTRSGEPMPLHEGRYTLLWRRTADDNWLIERYVDGSANFIAD